MTGFPITCLSDVRSSNFAGPGGDCPGGQSPCKGYAVCFCIAYRMTNNGLAGVIVAVPPRLDFTVTDVGTR